MFEDVKKFHEVFNLPVGTEPKFPNRKQRALRKRLMREEMKEYRDAEKNNDIVNLAKELADIIYIACGTAVVYGIDLDKVFAEVQRSNMSKLGLDDQPIYREDGKVLKGPNYSDADIKTVLGL